MKDKKLSKYLIQEITLQKVKNIVISHRKYIRRNNSNVYNHIDYHVLMNTQHHEDLHVYYWGYRVLSLGFKEKRC